MLEQNHSLKLWQRSALSVIPQNLGKGKGREAKRTQGLKRHASCNSAHSCQALMLEEELLLSEGPRRPGLEWRGYTHICMWDTLTGDIHPDVFVQTQRTAHLGNPSVNCGLLLTLSYQCCLINCSNHNILTPGANNRRDGKHRGVSGDSAQVALFCELKTALKKKKSLLVSVLSWHSL